ncbi:MAG: histidine phosphatase family protein [bacterium]|nr:histidine phosphatase family protein [bacterium]
MAAAPSDTHALLTIVRHGQTSANIDGVWHGSTNTPLTDHGRIQAAAVGRHIKANYRPVTHVYASPLDRAHHTAQAIADPLGLEPAIDPGLVEYDLGDWEGLSFHHLFEEKRLFHNMREDPHFAPHGGESPLEVGLRLAGSLRSIAERHPGERVVVVSHGGALSIAFGVLIDDDYSRFDRMMKNCAISELSFSPRPDLVTFNQIDHLPPEDPPSHTRQGTRGGPPSGPVSGAPT